MYHSFLPFVCWWTYRLLPCPSYYKQCCDEHWGTCVSFNSGLFLCSRGWNINWFCFRFHIQIKISKIIWKDYLNVSSPTTYTWVTRFSLYKLTETSYSNGWIDESVKCSYKSIKYWTSYCFGLENSLFSLQVCYLVNI